MCGVAGIVSFDGSDRARDVVRMLDALQHRGPDDEGTLTDGNVYLGHRRLAIIDLSERGAQPMTRGDASIVFNGEIYNYIELRRELIQLGYQFHSDSDTEVLLNAYFEWGHDCLNHMDGMWSFAIYDRSARVLFCSRDRFGEKPFYFHASKSFFAFASEPGALRRIGIGSSPDLETVTEYIALGFSTNANFTFYDGICQLAPGTSMTLDLSTNHLAFEQYYEPGSLGIFDGISPDDVAACFATEFSRAVSTRLRSDVPVGILLSGGIDSSLIAAFAGPAYLEARGSSLLAITALSGDPRNDESQYARAVAAQCGLDWHPVPVPAESIRSSWVRATQIQEQPIGSSSLVMQMRVMEAAKSAGLTVLLDGQGADESWLGYFRHAISAAANTPWSTRTGFVRDAAKNSGMGYRNFAATWLYFGLPQVAVLRNHFRSRQLGLPVSWGWTNRRVRRDVSLSAQSLRELSIREMQSDFLARLLKYEDRNSMAFSIESRLPFLDYRVVELAIAADVAIKFRGGWSKWPLRNELQHHVEPSIAWRRKKIGFAASDEAFNPGASDVARAVSASPTIRILGISADDLTRLPRPVAWRLFSVALWESTCVVTP